MNSHPRSMCALAAGAILSAAFLFAGTEHGIAAAAGAEDAVPVAQLPGVESLPALAPALKCGGQPVAGFEDHPQWALIVDGVTLGTGDQPTPAEGMAGFYAELEAEGVSIVEVHIECLASIANRTGLRLFGVPARAAVVIYTARSGLEDLHAGLREIHALQETRRAQEGSYAPNLEMLGWEASHADVSIELTLEEGGQGWTATGTLPNYHRTCSVTGSVSAPASDEPVRLVCEVPMPDPGY